MYKIMSTDKAEDQLRYIIYYIADDSGSIDTALKYLDKIEESTNRLKGSLNSVSISGYSILKKQGYGVAIVEKHLILYK